MFDIECNNDYDYDYDYGYSSSIMLNIQIKDIESPEDNKIETCDFKSE